jgi:hypothetical protein
LRRFTICTCLKIIYYEEDEAKEDEKNISFMAKATNACNSFVRRSEHAMWEITQWSLLLLERPLAVQPLKNFPTIYGTQMFIAAFIRALRSDAHCEIS